MRSSAKTGRPTAIEPRWSMRNAWRGMLLLLTATVGSGCATEAVRVSPDYPVFWNAEKVADCGLYFHSRDPLSFANSVVEVKRTVSELDVRLSLLNKTGKDILISREAETQMRWKVITLFRGKQSERGRPLYPNSCGQCSYDLLLSTAGEGGACILNRPIIFDIAVHIPLILREEADYSDIEIEIPVNYYVLGCEVPVEKVVKRTMRVVYVD